MRRAFAILLLILALIPAAAALSGDMAGGLRLVVIVNPARNVHLGLDDLTRIYLKRRRFWDDGEPIVALNQEQGSTAREEFSRRVLGRESARLGTYWNEQYFQGILPPVALSSGPSVKRYVASDRNAIGYIQLTEVDDSVLVACELD